MTDMLAPGTCVHGWKVIRHLREGRHGAFYAVERDGQPFVLKWLGSSQKSGFFEPPEVLAEREVTCLKLLRGPHVAALEAQGRWPEEEGGSFLVLQAVEGMTLTQWYHQYGPTARDMLHVFLGITSALCEMHRKGVRYPSISSGDITVRKGRLESVLTDIGGAFPGWGALTSDEIGEDLHAVGVMLYQALTRKNPGPYAPPPHVVNPRVPRELSEVAMRLLAPGPTPISWM
ncbi:protein kinase [Hyalangium versicolor]|uniref:protein kinase n=1 Tax=Hyalangium versicolor TaxID=2861190 RepID=UPI001CCDD302|nr:protein kinase [Hyalangium versicolor]